MMDGRWNVFAKARYRASESNAAENGTPLTGMIESGDFRIDLAQRTASLRGEVLQLSSDEFDVLVFLAGHPQSLVTPHTLLTTKWTANSHRRAKFLTALVSLRKKLEAAGPDQHYLRTEPWVVYRFDPSSSSAA